MPRVLIDIEVSCSNCGREDVAWQVTKNKEGKLIIDTWCEDCKASERRFNPEEGITEE